MNGTWIITAFSSSSISPTLAYTYSMPYSGLVNLRVTDSLGLTDEDTASVEIGGSDLAITKTVTPATAAPGATITYTLSFSNIGQFQPPAWLLLR
ncbi:MAG: hypothetical protein U0401_04575 [Anaerolineae bacterium]